nr:piggyBac transposable element-derived protein 4-like [Onthophagus taurus]
MSSKRPLSELELQMEIERIMNGEESNSELYSDSGSDWEEDNLEVDESISDDDDDTNSDEDVRTARHDSPVFSTQETRNVPIDVADVRSSTVVPQNVEQETDQNLPLSKIPRKEKSIILPNTTNLKGKNGHKWSAKLPLRSKRTASRNIVHFLVGSKGKAKECLTVEDHFLHFISNDILNIILQHTNEEITRQSAKYAKAEAWISHVSKEEIMAFFAVLLLSAVKKDNHLHVKRMFDSAISGSFYKSCMCYERFNFLVNCLRFDDKESREARKQDDPFTHIRKIWEIFIDTCRTSYTPSSYLTIDEQLLGFRGRCPFKMYIPTKPAKYGIKIVMLCDSSSKYLVDACPYLGKGTQTGGLPVANYFVKELTKSVHGSNRNITMDNWFTSVDLADELLQKPYKLTMLGTIKKNKREIPPQLLETKGRNPKTSMFCFDRNKTLVSYEPKKNKIVLLLSTMHDGAEISEENGKPMMILNYNETKGGVDTFDQLSSNMSCSRKTRRWPLCVFYGMVNSASINSYIVYCYNTFKRGEKPLSREGFMIELAYRLAKPWMEHRISVPSLRRNLRQNICEILKVDVVDENTVPQDKKRTICFYCPSKLRRMTTTYCVQCRKAFCGTHRGNYCTECASH